MISHTVFYHKLVQLLMRFLNDTNYILLELEYDLVYRLLNVKHFSMVLFIANFDVSPELPLF